MSNTNSKRGEPSAYVELRHRSAEMEVGTTDNRGVCPFCEGGRNGDRAFSLTKVSESEARYCCHRATCGKAGRVEAWGFRLRQDVDNSAPSRKKFTPRVYSGNTSELGREWLSHLVDRYGLSKEEANWADWREDIDSKRLVCPVRGPNKALRGYELRLGKGILGESYGGPKTFPFRLMDDIWMGWFRKIEIGPVLLVEDCISALKGARHFQTASLLGSHVSLDHVLEALEVAKGDYIFLALDKDATDKALKFISQWRFIAPNFVPVPLERDLKYMSDEEILKLLVTN